jgi:hypothetical protein
VFSKGVFALPKSPLSEILGVNWGKHHFTIQPPGITP